VDRSRRFSLECRLDSAPPKYLRTRFERVVRLIFTCGKARGPVNAPMTTTSRVIRKEVSVTNVAVAIVSCSTLWMASACEYYATSGLRLDWSATPLPWTLTAVVTPAICFGGCILLLDWRRRREPTLIEWWALSAAFLPVTLGSLLSVWIIRVLFSMANA
jgi:hypothetical protein